MLGFDVFFFCLFENNLNLYFYVIVFLNSQYHQVQGYLIMKERGRTNLHF